MTDATKSKRIQAVKLADALNAMEGVPVSDNAKTLSRCWVNGEITGIQMKAELLASHRKLAAQEQCVNGGEEAQAKYREYQLEPRTPAPHTEPDGSQKQDITMSME